MGEIKFLKKVLVVIFLTINACFIASCQGNVSTKKMIIEKSYKDFSYKIYETRNKTNEDNELQCAKYYEFNSNDSGYEIRGADLLNLFSFLINTQKKNIQLPKKIDTKFYEIIFEGINDSVSRSFIYKDILSYCKLEIKKYKVIEEGYELSILDPTKLNNYMSEPSQLTEVTLMNNKYILTNSNLKILSITLQDLYGKEFIYNSNHAPEKGYNLKFGSDKKLEENIDYIQKEYGIKFEKVSNNVSKYKIIEP